MCFKLPPFGPSCTPICSYSLQVLRICSFSTKEYMSTLSWPLHPVSVLIQGQDYYFAIFGRILRFDSTDTVLGVQVALTCPIPMLLLPCRTAKGLERYARSIGEGFQAPKKPEYKIGPAAPAPWAPPAPGRSAYAGGAGP